MPNLSFEIDWTDADGTAGRELESTWASLRIRAGEAVVTRVFDGRAETVRDAVSVPLYPLAEWLAVNWWFLMYECETPARPDPTFRARHALGLNREGYAFPNLEVVSSGAAVRVVWTRDRPRWTNVEFLDAGEMWLEGDEFRRCGAGLIDRVIRRLAARGVEGTLLQEEWAAVRTADEDEAEFCATAARLGWDPYALDDADHAAVQRLAERLGGTVLEEAAAALDPRSLDEGGAALAAALTGAKTNGLPLERLRFDRSGDRRAVHPTGPLPWEAGYRLARRLRGDLDIGNAPLNTMARLAEALGEAPAALDRVTRPVDFPGTDLVDGVVTRNDAGNPAFAFRRHRGAPRQSPVCRARATKPALANVGGATRRFLFCRGLAEALASPGADALVTRVHSGRQRRNRAFAAEFLAPSAALREALSGPVVDGDDVDELAATFGVSPRVIEHQIVNHRIAEVR